MGGTRESYTHGHHESVLRAHAWRTARDSADYLLGDLRPHVDVLDIGCGPGTITLDFAERVAPGRVHGVDSAPDPLELARDHAGQRGVPNATFRCADVYALPYEADSFDVVHAHQVLQHLTSPVTALREMTRVCRPGGIVAARDADYGGMRWYPDSAELSRWQRLYRALAHSNNANPDGGRFLKSWALLAGCTEVSCSASAWCHASDEERARWGGSWAERVLHSAFASQALDRGLTTSAELEWLAAGWQAWAAAPDGWFLVPHGEIRCTVSAG